MNDPDDAPASGERDGEETRHHGSGRSEGSDRSDPPDRSDPAAVHICEICGAEMFETHCKIICPRCGYRRDCSDP